jgi:hypothetical protein
MEDMPIGQTVLSSHEIAPVGHLFALGVDNTQLTQPCTAAREISRCSHGTHELHSQVGTL